MRMLNGSPHKHASQSSKSTYNVRPILCAMLLLEEQVGGASRESGRASRCLSLCTRPPAAASSCPLLLCLHQRLLA